MLRFNLFPLVLIKENDPQQDTGESESEGNESGDDSRDNFNEIQGSAVFQDPSRIILDSILKFFSA